MKGARFLLLSLFLLTSGCAWLGGDKTIVLSLKESGDESASDFMKLATEARKQGNMEYAVHFYTRAHDKDASDPAALVGLGEALNETDHPREAAASFRAALDRDKKNIAATIGLGQSLLAVGQYADSLHQFQTAMTAEPKNRRARIGFGIAQDLLGNHTAAQNAYGLLLTEDPNDLAVQNNLGFSFILSGKRQAAIELFEKLAADPRATARQRQNLALAYGITGRQKDAEKLARMDLDNHDVARNLAFYQKFQANEDSEHPRPAPTDGVERTPLPAPQLPPSKPAK